MSRDHAVRLHVDGGNAYGDLTVTGFATDRTALAVGEKFAGVLREQFPGGQVDVSPAEPSPAVAGDVREWLCSRCNVIHPPKPGEFLTAPCPDCDSPMIPTSPNLREIERLRTQLAEARAWVTGNLRVTVMGRVDLAQRSRGLLEILRER